VPPEAKYEADGGPDMDRVLDVLDGSMTREQDRRDFFKAQLLFWMLCATDGHAKNFSLFLRPGGRYQLTPLYDVLSAYPVLGKGPSNLSPFKAKMAMAVRSTNAHWKMRDILRRHWLALGKRHGVLTEDGREVDRLIEDHPGSNTGGHRESQRWVAPGMQCQDGRHDLCRDARCREAPRRLKARPLPVSQKAKSP
jgi:serine/threonine-protein kinase HipA